MATVQAIATCSKKWVNADISFLHPFDARVAPQVARFNVAKAAMEQSSSPSSRSNMRSLKNKPIIKRYW